MNRKGFTLTELIVTIGLLAVIGLVIVTNMSGLLEKNKEENYQNFVKAIEDAACALVELKIAGNYINNFDSCLSTDNGCRVSVGDLLAEGLLSEEETKSPKTGQPVTTSTVTIKYANGTKKKTCTFTE